MRLLSILLLGVSASENQTMIEGKSLMEVYGERRQVTFMSRDRRRRRVVGRLGDDQCDFPLDIILATDCTKTMEDEWDVLINSQLPQALESVLISHPKSRFHSMLFQDKPVDPFGLGPSAANGYYSDFCVRTDGTFHTSADETLELYRQHTPYGGGDVYESQFVTLLAASQLPFDWSRGAVKLIVVITDAPPHFDLDGLNNGMAAHSDKYDQADPERQCKTQYYPSPEQVKKSVTAIGAYVAVVAFEHKEMNSLVSRSWQWFNRHLDQTDAFLRVIEEPSTMNLAQELQATIAEIERVECGSESTTPTPGTAPTFITRSASASWTEVLDTTASPEQCPPCPTVCALEPSAALD